MKKIDVTKIVSDPTARLAFLSDFVGFTDEDWQAVRDSAAALGPLLPGFLDALYEHLLSYDDTRTSFVTDAGAIDDDYMAMRKEHLTQWVLRMVGGIDNGPEELATYWVNIARKHTSGDGEANRSIAPRYMVALTSFIQTGLLSALFELLPDDPGEVRRIGLAWNKLLMIQLEMFLSVMAPQWPHWDEAPAT